MFLAVTCSAEDILGFRDMLWGDSPAKLGKYTVEKKYPTENKVMYKRSSDELKIGDAKLKEILYDFFDNKLEKVIINFEGSDNLFAIKQAFETKYKSNGFVQPNKYMDQYFLVNVGQADISILCSTGATNCYVFITNKNISKEAEEYKKNVAKKGAKDL